MPVYETGFNQDTADMYKYIIGLFVPTDYDSAAPVLETVVLRITPRDVFW